MDARGGKCGEREKANEENYRILFFLFGVQLVRCGSFPMRQRGGLDDERICGFLYGKWEQGTVGGSLRVGEWLPT